MKNTAGRACQETNTVQKLSTVFIWRHTPSAIFFIQNKHMTTLNILSFISYHWQSSIYCYLFAAITLVLTF